jgi:hypothetical protein
MVIQEQVDIIMAELQGDVGALLNDLDRGVFSREQAARILALTLDSAKHEIKAIIPPDAPRGIN